MTPLDLMQLYQQSCSGMNMAAKLSVKLFDKETRLTYNVLGKGKAKLNWAIIKYRNLLVNSLATITFSKCQGAATKQGLLLYEGGH